MSLIRAMSVGEIIDGAFAVEASSYPVVLIPSASAEGTNGLLLSPPTAIEPAFEGRSFVAHRRLCAAAGLKTLSLALEGFAVDVDTLEDLEQLAGARGRSADLVRSWQPLPLGGAAR